MRLGNLEALINLATQYEDLCRSAQHAASISGLQLWLAETAEGRQDMLAEPAIDAVKILTWHGAKGLEWPVVILADLATDIRDRLWSISAGPGAKFDVQAPLEGRIIRYWPWPFGKLKNVGLADDIARAPVAEAFRQAALDETKRLVYVAMTRARDLMVLARSDRKLNGEWLDSVEAPWLLPADDEEFVTLPSGKTIRADLWTLNPLVDAADLAQPLPPVQWFLTQPAGRSRLPLSFSPSASGKVARAQHETCRIGQRIAVREGTDMNVLGTALHACLALSFTDPDRPLEISDVERLLAAFGVREEVSGEHVLAQSKALHGWIASRWPGARVLAEYPVQSLPDSCQVLNGRLDVVLETSQGFVLIDHKSSPLAAAHWERLAEDYSAQLGAYADAITRATGKPVTEQWLFLPVAAGGLRIA